MTNSIVTNARFIVSGSGAISLWLDTSDGRHPQFSISSEHPNHRAVVEKLKTRDYSNLEELCEDPSQEKAAQRTLVEEVAKRKAGPLVGTAEVRDGVVFVNQVPVHNVVTERIIGLSSAGFPVEPVLRFLELLLQNPSSKAQEELYDFLANRNLPLTEDGHFLGYKRVREDFKDIYSGRIDNSIGRIVEVPRDAVDPNRANECSHGLHVGALDYVRGYGSGGHVLVVKVSPQDCVSVPRDHHHMKLRTCRYEVLYEMSDDTTPLERPVYSSSGEEFGSMREFSDANNDGDSDYWSNGWDSSVDEYEQAEIEAERRNLTVEFSQLDQDSLAWECQQRGLVRTRQEGRDMGREQMVKMLVNCECPLTPEEDWDNSTEEQVHDKDAWTASSSCYVWQDSGC